MRKLEETKEGKRRRKDEILIEAIVEGNEEIKQEKFAESGGTGR
jgi:hypothetical protein